MNDSSFVFSPVFKAADANRPARAGQVYIVSVDPPTGSGLSRKLIKGVSVTAKTETSLGTVIL